MFGVLVIGSGFGGLTAAALAAKAGLNVLVAEQHTRPGGCAGDFALDGFLFPAGATVITGLEDGGILRQVFDTLDIDVETKPLDPSIQVHIEDDCIPYQTTLEGWLDTFTRAYPDAPAGYRRFWKWTGKTGGAVYNIGASLPSLPIRSLSDVRRTLRAARPGNIRAVPAMFETVENVKKRLGATGHAQADAIIDGLLLVSTGATAKNCSAVQGAIALDLYRRGCQWVDGGTGKLAMQLVRSIRQRGGEVRFGVRVSDLQRVGGSWLAETGTGETIRAKRIVANVPPAALAPMLRKKPALPNDSDAWGAFVVHLGIDASGLPPAHPFHLVIPEAVGALHDGGNAFVSIFPGRGTRAHQWAISISTHTRASTWFEGDNCARRKHLEEVLLSATERVIPGVRERVMVLRSATPLTFERYTGRPGGYVGGLVQARSRVALLSPGHRVAPGLVMAGDHTFPGQGTVGTALSGINAARDIIESLGQRSPL